MSKAPASAPNPAESYEQYVVPVMFRPCAVDLIARARPQATDRVLDLACGTGVVARECAPLVGPGGRVDALDFNPGMLSVARAIAESEALAISFYEGDMQQLPFEDKSYDLVICQQGLQFIPDRDAAVTEMRRVLADNGRAFASCWSAIENHPLTARMAPLVERHFGVPAMNQPYALGNEADLRAPFEAAGFVDIQVHTMGLMARFPQPDRFVSMIVGAIVAAIPSMQQTPPDERERMTTALRVDLDPVLQEFVQGDELVSPIETLIVEARR